ncbi:MAG: DUF748 domain-containing protein [Pontibacterium sp.]
MRWALGILLLIVLTLHNLPYVIRDQAVIWLRDQGVESAGIKTLRIHWFKGIVELEGLYALSADKLPLKLDRLLVSLDYAALAEQRIYLKTVQVQGLVSGLVSRDKTQWLGPLNLSTLLPDEADQEQAPEEPGGANWQLGLDELELVDFDWQLALDNQQHQLTLNHAKITGFHQWQAQQATQIRLTGNINNAPLQLDTQVTSIPDHKSSLLNLKVNNFPLHSVTAAFEPELQAYVDLDLKIDAQLQGGGVQLTQTGLVRVRDFQWQQENGYIRQPRLQWQGDLALTLNNDKLSRVALEGKLAMDQLDLAQAEQQVQFGSLSLTSVVKSTDMTNFQVSLPHLSLDALHLKDGADMSVLLARLMLTGTTLNATVSPGEKQLAVNLPNLMLSDVSAESASDGSVKFGQLHVKDTAVSAVITPDKTDLKLSVPALGLSRVHMQDDLKKTLALAQIDLERLDLTAALTPEAPPSLALHLPEASLNDFSVSADAEPLITLGELKLNQLELALPLTLSAGRMDLSALLVQAEEGPLLRISQSHFKTLDFKPDERLSLGLWQINGSETTLNVSEQGALPDIEWLKAKLQGAKDKTEVAVGQAGSASDKTPDQAAPAELAVRLGRFLLEGQNLIHFSDSGTRPVFQAEVAIEALEVKTIDTTSPEPGSFSLAARINGFAQLEAEGLMLLTGKPHDGHWQLSLKGLELPPLSPYAERFTGYYLHSGQLNLNSKGTITEGALKGENQLRLHRLSVDQRDVDQIAAFTQKITMPLETAIMIMEDNDNNIKLDIPVTGSVDDPSFGYQSVINNLAAKGLKSAAMSFLTKSLQPYATLISLAKSAIDASEKGAFITLTPVSFPPGSAAPDATALDYLNKLSDMLNERQAMKLNICGRAVPADRVVLEPALLDENKKRKKPLPAEVVNQLLIQRLEQLASARAARVKALMAAQVDSERLFLCTSQVDTAPDAQARVELGL